MWTTLVIILSPVINYFPGVSDIAESAFIQTHIPKSTVKALDKTTLNRLTRLKNSKLYTMPEGPLVQAPE